MGRYVQFGAGNIGRSLCGALMSKAGYEVVFVDLDRALVDALNEKHSYSVIVKDKKPAEIKVTGVRAVGAWNVDAVADEVVETHPLAPLATIPARQLDEIPHQLAYLVQLAEQISDQVFALLRR